MKRLCGLALTGVLWTGVVLAQTQPAHSDASDELIKSIWLNAGFLSHHLQNDQSFNDTNTGLGIEVPLSSVYSLTAGQYINSNNATTHYLGACVMPLQWGTTKAGFAVGGFNGYPTYKGGGWFAAAVPALEIETHNWGLNILYVPPVIPQVASVLSFQIKYRFD